MGLGNLRRGRGRRRLPEPRHNVPARQRRYRCPDAGISAGAESAGHVAGDPANMEQSSTKVSRLSIVKFIGAEQDSSFTVPGPLIGLAVRLLPRAALSSLAGRGIDLAAIAAALKSGDAYSSSAQVRERGFDKTVLASIDA
jgi:hypothetical protein